MSTTTETSGSIRLVQEWSSYVPYSNGEASVELMCGEAPAAAGQAGQKTPNAAEHAANGYEVAWQASGANQYLIWLTDHEGNSPSNILDGVSGASAAPESTETSFGQDFNGDGTFGLVESLSPSDTPPDPNAKPSDTIVIAGAGSITPTQTVTGLHFDAPGSNDIGPSLKYLGAGYLDGQSGGEQTASGSEVSPTDPNSHIFIKVPGASTTLQPAETSVHQDLAANVTTEAATTASTVIESFGSTSLTETGGHFFLDDSSGTGPSLKYQGSDYVAGQFGSITPIGAEQTATGYEVAWKVPGADQYSVWITDSNGNYVANALSNVSGSSAALQSMEASFHQDLNGDGTISSPSQGSSPQFSYLGIDAEGAQLYSISWGAAGLQPFEVRVLTPEHPAANVEHSFLYALPVEGGLDQSTWGDGLNQLQQLDVEDQYNTTIIEPIFPIDPWYANSATDPTINYETFMATILPAWVESNFATNGTEENLLLGFSKSGYGALDLLFKHPDVFEAAAAWDFPADMSNFSQYAASDNYGTEANFQENYQLTAAFIDSLKAPFTTEDRIWISGYAAFQSDVSDFDALLTSQGVLHTFSPQTFDAHNWYSGWLSGAVAGLYGLVDGGTSDPPPPPPSGTVVENFGSTSLTEIDDHFYLYDSSSNGPSLKYQGANYVAGQFGSITPIAAEQTATGYEVAWKAPGLDQYSVWLTDANGNYLSNALISVPGTSSALESMETSFHQDINGDGMIGPPAPSSPIVVENFGSTSLTEIDNHFYLYDSSGNGPSLKYQGADYVAGQFGSIAPIAAEQTATGYEVAWSLPGANQYSVWLTDANGNYLSNALTSMSGTSNTLESMETSFHQDLNGDGTIGPPAPSGPVMVENFGSTSLTETDNHFYLYDNSGNGPSLKYQGADYVDGEFGSITPIAAEQTATGYEVAWKVPGLDQFSVWLTDANGNYLSNALTSVSGTSNALESIETSFHQDLNGDGMIGPPTSSSPIMVENFGSTSLTEINDHFYLDDSSGNGPSLKYQGADYVDGEFGLITPIAAEQTATGYEVAWSLPGADQFSVWLTDADGNYLSNALTSVPGTSSALESTETSFHQDINGDGTIGPASPPPSTVVESFGSTSLTRVGALFYLDDSTGDGPSLKYQGADYVDGQFGSITPIAAEQTTTGYEVAWKVPGADQFSVWLTDSNGNYLSNALTNVPGTNSALETMETSFHQDLNGDGYQGLVLDGSSGGQTLTAGSSSTTLIGGPSDILGGGSAADTFVFLPNSGANTVNNFAPATDELQFSHTIFADANAALGAAQQEGSDVVITADASDVVTLHNQQLINLHATDFHIV